ncbi:MAG: phosphotransferase [Hyphomicrobium sp.]|uniref:phosphotransferase n=1 Tax=Hyphomicrobium sp. TaxID=82 RepID=UPI003D104BF1
MSVAEQDLNDVRAALNRLGIRAAVEGGAASVQRLGGLTNRVYLIAGPHRSTVLRIPGAGTEEYINRKVEAVAARAAAGAGVSPEVLASTDDGLMLTVAIANAVTMSPENFATIPGAPTRAAHVLRKLHTSGATFDFRFELFAMIDDYLKVLSGKTVDLPAGYHDVLASAESVRQALNARPLPLAPCHCDPLSENFIDAGGRMWLVDWEYSGMNDPLWDLGDVIVEAKLAPDKEAELIGAYFGGTPTPAEHGRVVIYKAMCDLLWTLWGLIQHANKNPADDFWTYATGRFERCKALMATPEFRGHVTAVARG